MRNRKAIFAALSLAVGSAAWTASGELPIDTIAGGGPNELPALAANLSNPAAAAVDADGNTFVAAAHRVFRIDASGQLTIVAGNGAEGFSGDGGIATHASLARPSGVAVDAAGNLFIADSSNDRIRRVDAVTRVITTVAGAGFGGFGGDGGPATSALLGFPTGVVLDAAGNLFIADGGNRRVRRVDSVTQIITTVAGSGAFGFSGDGGPATSASFRSTSGVALDAAGSLYIADEGNNRVRRVDAISGIITTIAGTGSSGFSGDGGLATAARLQDPSGVAIDAAGNLFIADFSNNRIRRVDAISRIITTAAGNGMRGFSGDGGPATSASLGFPRGVAFDAQGSLLIVDSGNHRIRRVDATGTIDTSAGNGTAGFSGDHGLATNAGIASPGAVALDAAGNVFIADAGNSRIRRVDAFTGVITTVAGGSTGFSGDGGTATSASLLRPSGVTLDAMGNLFIADSFNHRIRRVDAITQLITTVAGDGTQGFGGDGGVATSASLNIPFGVALDAAGNLFIADLGNSRVRRVDAITRVITTVAGDEFGGFSGDGGPATSARLDFPSGVALDAAGNLFIADRENHRIRRVDSASGTISTVAGNGCTFWGGKRSFGCFGGDGGPATSASLAEPRGVALDAAGNLFIADWYNNRIRRVSAADGTISTIAGNGDRCAVFGRDGSRTGCFGGDGGPATGASLSLPAGVALDALGNLFIADERNDRIRKVGDAALAIRVDIDVKPGSDPNSINPSDRGVIPVAILGSEDFDVSEIDAASLSIAAGGALPAHDLGDPTVLAGHLADVNGDGITDLVSHYWTEESGIVYGDMTACLSGSTFDGLQLSGCDAVRTVPDMDGDRLLDADERGAGTNAFFRDSDGDGYDDGVEVLTMGTDPLDALDPAPAPVEPKKPSRLHRRHR